MSVQSLALAFALAVLPVAAARGQDSTKTSEAIWVSIGAGYTAPSLAGVVEGWLTNGRATYGLVFENTPHGDFDRSYSTLRFLAFGGVRHLIGPVRTLVAVGGSFGDHGSDDSAALRPVWQVSADLPFSEHVALHVARSALIGGPQLHVATTFGLSIGVVR